MQIFNVRKDNSRFWSVWHAPKGTAVDPCFPTTKSQFVLKTSDILLENDPGEPPLLPKVTWGKPSIGGPPAGLKGCLIIGKGQDGAPEFRCEGNVEPFKKDVRFGDGVMTCDGAEYARTWTVEY